MEALEFLIRQECEYTDVPLKELPTKPEYLIACIGRKGRIIIPGGDDRIQAGDSVVIVTTERGTEDLREMFRR